MSIEMKNPESVLGKIDAANNYVQQMYISHGIRDEANFKHGHGEAVRLLFLATQQIQESGVSANDFLKSKGIIKEGYSKWICKFEDGTEFDIGQLMQDFLFSITQE